MDLLGEGINTVERYALLDSYHGVIIMTQLGSIDENLATLGLEALVYIFNNDRFRECYGVVPYIKEPEICYESYPHVAVIVRHRNTEGFRRLRELGNREYELVLYDESGAELYSFRGVLKLVESPLTPTALVSEHVLNQRISEARYALIRIGSLKQSVELPRMVRIHGKVTDFEGKPQRAYVRIVSVYGYPVGAIDTKTDENGYFEIYGPEGVYHHVFVCDGEYARSKLEFYAWNFPVRYPETVLNPRFDKIEIYRLSAAATPERTLLIHFVPWDIAYTNVILRKIYEDRGKVTLRDICGLDIVTPLTKRDIEVYLDDVELEVRTMRKVEYSLKDYGVECMAKAYLVEAKIPSFVKPGEYVLRLVAHTVVDGIEEWGEALLYGVRIL